MIDERFLLNERRYDFPECTRWVYWYSDQTVEYVTKWH